MTHQNPPPDELRRILTEAKTIALVGASAKPHRVSHRIMHMLQAVGYRVIPVNPKEGEVLGEKSYRAVEDVPEEIDIVNVFRRSEDTPPVAEGAVKAKAKVLWLQLGIYNEDSARIAEEGGLQVVMDSCIAVVHRNLEIPTRR